MTNEELAAAVKAGEPGAMLELWEAVRRFVEMKARDRARAGRVPFDDLKQAGFLAVVDAVEKFDPEREGGSFLSLLSLTLKSRFAAEAGIRSSKRDAILYADSADVAAYRNDPDSETIADTIPDESAALAFMGVDYGDFMDYCRGVIGAALDALPDTWADILRLHYLNGLTLEDAASICGFTCKQTAEDAEKRAFYRLEHGKYQRELRECIEAFEDFHTFLGAARCETWRRTGISRTEAAALIKR